MELPEERRNALKLYCRIDDPDGLENELLAALYAAAVAYLDGAGIGEPTNDPAQKALYDQVINAIVLDGYDRRGGQTSGAALADNPAFRRQLLQLKLSGPEVTAE